MPTEQEKNEAQEEGPLVKNKDFVEEVLWDLRRQFDQKNKEYKGATADRWRNFSQGGELQSETPEQTLLGYVSKQIVNLFDAKHHNPERLTDVDFINEKAGDAAVYMIILMAMVREKAAKQGLADPRTAAEQHIRTHADRVDRVFQELDEFHKALDRIRTPLWTVAPTGEVPPRILSTEEQRAAEAKFGESRVPGL